MPRKSVKDQRVKEIVSAFERCIARNGIEGALLEQIAAESGIQRPALRHFVGNRDKLIITLTKSIVDEYASMLTSAGKLLDRTGNTSEDLLIVLFMQSRLTTSDRVIVLLNLFSIAPKNENVRAELQVWYLRFIEWVTGRLKKLKPKAKKEDLKNIAVAIVSMSFNFASLTPLELADKELDAAIKASVKLIETL